MAVLATGAYGAGTRPAFQLPFNCGTTWKPTTYDKGEELSKGKVVRSWSHLHYLDFERATAKGDPVLASAAGHARLTNRAEGKVEITHGGGWKTVYQHMQGITVDSKGRDVHRGERLGTILGNVGTSTGPHLHYAQLADGIAQRPLFNGAAYSFGTGKTSTTRDGRYRFTNDRTAKTIIKSANCAARAEAVSSVPQVLRIAGASHPLGADYVVTLYFSDAECNVIGGTWYGPDGSGLAPRGFGAGGAVPGFPTTSTRYSCANGYGSFSPFSLTCSAPGQQRGRWTEYVILRDARGNVSPRFTFVHECT
jgi:hypothetical protein